MNKEKIWFLFTEHPLSNIAIWVITILIFVCIPGYILAMTNQLQEGTFIAFLVVMTLFFCSALTVLLKRILLEIQLRKLKKQLKRLEDPIKIR